MHTRYTHRNTHANRYLFVENFAVDFDKPRIQAQACHYVEELFVLNRVSVKVHLMCDMTHPYA